MTKTGVNIRSQFSSRMVSLRLQNTVQQQVPLLVQSPTGVKVSVKAQPLVRHSERYVKARP